MGKIKKNTINITNKSQEASPAPAGGHKAAMNRRKALETQDTNYPQKVPPWNGQ